MVEIFDRELIVHDGLSERFRIVECMIVQVKYRPGKNCLITYLLRIHDLNREEMRELSITALACRRGESLSVFADVMKRPHAPVPIVRGIFHLPELETVALVFPNDRKLTGLPFLIDAEHLLNDLLPEVIAHSLGNDWEIEGLTKHVIHYVPERACTVRVGLKLSNRRTSRLVSRVLFGKTYCLDEDELAWRGFQHLWDSEARREGRLLIPQPLAYQPQIKTVWQSGLEGKTLNEYDRSSEAFSDLLMKGGAAVAALHEIKSSSAPVIATPDIVAGLEMAGTLLTRVRPSCSNSLHSLIKRLAATANSLGERPFATLHGDLHLKNLFVTDGRIALIDLDSLAQGDPLRDVGSFIAAIHYRGILEGSPVRETEQIAGRFIRAYRANVSWEVPESGLNWHIAAALIDERAYRCVTRMKAGRLAIIDDLIDLARKISGLI
jgi:thiamine kinase-like enzyme